MSDFNDKIGALWQRTSAKGTTYLTGEINGQKIVAFPNRKEHDKQPDWQVYKSQPRPQDAD